MPIPEEVQQFMEFTMKMLKMNQLLKKWQKRWLNFWKDAIWLGLIPIGLIFRLLAEEFLRADIDIDFKKRKFIDVQAIFHKMEKRTLAAAYKFYCNKELIDAHSAMADTKATYEVLKSQLDVYKDVNMKIIKGKKSVPIVNDVEKLSEFSSYDQNVDFVGRIVYNEDGVEVFNFGKNKGIPVEKVLTEQPGYFGWIMNSEFPLYTKKVLTQIKLRMMNK